MNLTKQILSKQLKGIIMQAILINPFSRTISTVDIDSKDGSMDYLQMKQAINVDLIDIVCYNKFDLIVDDEGFYSKGDNQEYFHINNGGGSFNFHAGCALVTSSDVAGNTISAKVDEGYIRYLVRWCDKDIGDTQANKIMNTQPTVIGFDSIDELFAHLGKDKK